MGTSARSESHVTQSTQQTPHTEPFSIDWYINARAGITQIITNANELTRQQSIMWYRIYRKTLEDLPWDTTIRGGSSKAHEYAAKRQAICTAIGVSEKTFRNHRTVARKIADENELKSLLDKYGSWWRIVASGVNMAPPRHQRTVAVPAKTMDYLISKGLPENEITRIIARYLKLPDIQQDIISYYNAE